MRTLEWVLCSDSLDMSTWRVEGYCCITGEMCVVLFSGLNAKAEAEAYLDWRENR